MTRILMRAVGIGACIGLAACSESGAEPQSAPIRTEAADIKTVETAPVIRVSATQTVDSTPAAAPLVQAARGRLQSMVVYDGRYVSLDYPGGDVPAYMGVCTDVVIRSLRKAYDLDLQKAVHEDMKANFSAYPTNWGLTRTDKNIDHRRVPNLETYFTRTGYDLPITKKATDYKPGDIVSWRLDSNSGSGGLPHIGIVSDRVSRRGNPLIIHNIGGGPEESDMLFDHRITGHFRITL